MDEQGDEPRKPATKRARFAKHKTSPERPLESYLRIHRAALDGRYKILILTWAKNSLTTQTIPQPTVTHDCRLGNGLRGKTRLQIGHL